MTTVLFVTHPEVVFNPAVPVPSWHLSQRGIERMRSFAGSDTVARVSRIVASGECKAIEAAGILAGRPGLPVEVHHGLGENDRSATGFVPPHIFEQLADAFFARPSESVAGWETALSAQARVVAAVEDVLAGPLRGDVAIVSHGAVGTLLACHLAGWPIDRRHDQPGQGHWFAFEAADRRLLGTWAPITPR